MKESIPRESRESLEQEELEEGIASISTKPIATGDMEQVGEIVDRLLLLSTVTHTEVANRLINEGYGDFVTGRLEEFKDLDSTVANKLIEQGKGWAVAKHLEKFKNINYVEIANKLIEQGKGPVVINYLEKFKDIDHAEVANKLIDAGKEGVAEHLEEFKNIDHVEIANKLIEQGKGWAVVKHLEKFKNIDHTEIANKLIDAGKIKAIVKRFDSFRNLNSDIIKQLIEAEEEDPSRAEFTRLLDLALKRGFTKAEIAKYPVLMSSLLGKG